MFTESGSRGQLMQKAYYINRRIERYRQLIITVYNTGLLFYGHGHANNHKIKLVSLFQF